MPVALMWFRSDLRLRDHPALRAALAAGTDGVVPVFVLDDHLDVTRMPVRAAYLSRLLAEFDERIGGLHLVRGRPEVEIPRLVRQTGATSVHVTAAHTPYGLRRDQAVAEALGTVPLVRTGSGYAVDPGTIRKTDGTAYRVFTPFFRSWQDRGTGRPVEPIDPAGIPWLRPGGGTGLPEAEPPDGVALPPVGERAALEHWHRWLDDHVDAYATERDRPDLDTTSRMSVHLKWGTVHPRTLLADLAERASDGARAYERQLAFREFYADVLHERPDSAHGYYDRRYERMRYDEPAGDFEAWQQGRTGFPFIDAGMRQLLAEGWMHNRARMAVASFLVKDLHLEWTHGAHWFLERLVDADLANNQHGWQWVAGCGTDAAPYFRVFNPVAQGRRLDPDGTYVRRWVPELRDVPGPAVHEPWTLDAPPADYPPPLVDHALERAEALRRHADLGR
ncbi:deoxyribodipyrimidine photo-lyase [Aeromicrobium sp. 636]|uniref:Deoxyribodipyrimidine photo-lyase n=1 Tax=Aeromicrobium senzhongii TaxID=2663859 RepID=A0A8I0K2Q5_9ACTN|nr:MULTISPECIES: deoxyribodipyrimidine photo-lyase [Aeromicrobium]MBC9226165.1 deoxyribodipyrimidine photo-lyase [Aeromicrobium senzhongii]MCQ3998271.1 deoxyribodipyrimidine photo-lyase [Aeromicrobium sp. 636]